MLCAISGEAPQVPVASRKSGTVFEKRLIEAYIQENGRDPVTGEELTSDDLVELKSARVVKPRPPTLTSIPSLLSVFQNEWDALALETYTLKQHLSQLRQELSTALYNNDAAVRVIARLTKERDEARDALGKVSMQDRRTAGTSNGVNGDAMQVDGVALPDDLAAKVDATQDRLSRTRRRRPVPQGWATAESIKSLDFTSPIKVSENGSQSLATNSTGTTALVGGSDGSSSTVSITTQEILQTAQGDGSSVNCILAWEQDSREISIVATSVGEVALLENGRKAASFTKHSGPATGLALHPCGDILASVGADKSFVFYDLSRTQVVSQIFTDSELTCCQFHPDGHLFAAGSKNGDIKIFDVKTSDNVANYSANGPTQSLSFSENGTWLAAVVKGSSSVGVWDLRKGTEIKTLDFGSKIDCVRWDYTGQYLVGAGPGCVAVQAYDKGSKAWSEPLSRACAAKAVEWGPEAKSLVVLTTDGDLTVLR